MPISEDALHLVNMMDTILDRVVGRFEQVGVDLPNRQYWTTSEPAADCEQLVVFFNQAYVGPVGDEADTPQMCDSPRTAQIGVQILRCIPTPVGTRQRMPSEEAIQESARQQAIDAYVLLDVASSLDTWDGDLPGRGMGVIATVDAGLPEGGFQGPTLNLTVAIP